MTYRRSAFETADRGIGTCSGKRLQRPGRFENLRRRRSANARDERMDGVFALFPDLAALKGQLPDPERRKSRMLACSRALMQDPKLLLLDELPPAYPWTCSSESRDQSNEGVSIVLAEQNHQGLAVADRVAVPASAFLTEESSTSPPAKQGYRFSACETKPEEETTI
jgi:ABC-type branched-subunit amino acid transport system ATPase component